MGNQLTFFWYNTYCCIPWLFLWEIHNLYPSSSLGLTVKADGGGGAIECGIFSWHT